MAADTLTLDTNLLLEYWKNQKKRSVVERLLELAGRGEVDLSVTARIHEDVPRPPLAERLNQLRELSIEETGSVTRLDFWDLGRDILGDDRFVAHSAELDAELRRTGKTPPDWRDWDHVHAHYLMRRDVFLTWDERIVELAGELKARLGLRVITPEEYLASR